MQVQERLGMLMEKKCAQTDARVRQGFFLSLLDIPPQLFRLWIYTNKINRSNGGLRAYSLVFFTRFLRQALVTISNLEALRFRNPELMSCFFLSLQPGGSEIKVIT